MSSAAAFGGALLTISHRLNEERPEAGAAGYERARRLLSITSLIEPTSPAALPSPEPTPSPSLHYLPRLDGLAPRAPGAAP